MVIQGQIAVSKRDRHPPIIRALSAENLRQLYADSLRRIKGFGHRSLPPAQQAFDENAAGYRTANKGTERSLGFVPCLIKLASRVLS